MYDCLFLGRLQYDIDNAMKSFKEDGPSYNWEHSKGESVSEFLSIDIRTLDNGGFQFDKTEIHHYPKHHDGPYHDE